MSKKKGNSSVLEQKHLYHLVDPSPWPLLTSTSALSLLIGVVMYMHSFTNGLFVALIGLSAVIICMGIWWRDVIREATYEGRHSSLVQIGLRYGMILFILSEVLFFVAFFWAFFHSSLSPTIEIGSIWPPEGVITLNPWDVPLLNTVILLLSGASLTWSHHSVLAGSRKDALLGLEVTISLALIFVLLQGYEYFYSQNCIHSGIYGSAFFMSTGFHGLHIIIGLWILVVVTLRLYKHHFTKEHHFGFEAGAWYWHFVDVVWLFLFAGIYWWGGLSIV